MIVFHLIISLYFVTNVSGLDNGLALTPPMGWMHWERFRCTIDCTLYPNDCISEKLFISIANRMVDDGYLLAGYEYVIIDDCWLANERDSEGRLQPDPDRFPNGIKALADYIHSKGLKLGIYEDYGNFTCAGYPGLMGYLEVDANTFAEWGVDYLKVDGCYAELDDMEAGYAELGAYLNETGRPIVFSCSFPAYKGLDTDYTAAVKICNLWRNYDDIQDSWNSVKDISDWFIEYQEYITQFVGPGHWNDPDMLIIGNFGLSYDQCMSQMTIWVLLPAPLLMSVDLRTLRPEFREILLNKDAIRINQDPLGIPGRRYMKVHGINVWLKPMLPIVEGRYSYAVGFVSYREDGFPYLFEFHLKTFKLDHPNGYKIKNVFGKSTAYAKSIADSIPVLINPSGAVLLEITPISVNKTQTEEREEL